MCSLCGAKICFSVIISHQSWFCPIEQKIKQLFQPTSSILLTAWQVTCCPSISPFWSFPWQHSCVCQFLPSDRHSSWHASSQTNQDEIIIAQNKLNFPQWVLCSLSSVITWNLMLSGLHNIPSCGFCPEVPVWKGLLNPDFCHPII